MWSRLEAALALAFKSLYWKSHDAGRNQFLSELAEQLGMDLPPGAQLPLPNTPPLPQKPDVPQLPPSLENVNGTPEVKRGPGRPPKNRGPI